MAYNSNYGVTVNGSYIPAGGKKALLQPFDPYAVLTGGAGSVAPFTTASMTPATYNGRVPVSSSSVSDVNPYISMRTPPSSLPAPGTAEYYSADPNSPIQRWISQRDAAIMDYKKTLPSVSNTPSSGTGSPATNPTYNVNTTPTKGIQNPTGLVPGALPAVTPWQAGVTTMPTPGAITAAQVGAPSTVAMPNPYADLLKVIPGLAGMNAKAGSVISNDLSGRISPDVQRAIQTGAAQFSTAGGMPGSVGQPGSLYNFKDLATLGTTSDANQQRGLASYGDFLKTTSGTQTVSPGVQAGVNEANAGAQNQVALTNAAALNNYGQFNANALNSANQWNAGAANTINLANAGAGNEANALNVQIADRNATNAAAADPWLAMNYAADLYARNSAATAGKPYTSMFNSNTSTGQFGGWASPAAATVNPWDSYLNSQLQLSGNENLYEKAINDQWYAAHPGQRTIANLPGFVG